MLEVIPDRKKKEPSKTEVMITKAVTAAVIITSISILYLAVCAGIWLLNSDFCF